MKYTVLQVIRGVVVKFSTYWLHLGTLQVSRRLREERETHQVSTQQQRERVRDKSPRGYQPHVSQLQHMLSAHRMVVFDAVQNPIFLVNDIALPQIFNEKIFFCRWALMHLEKGTRPRVVD